MIAGRKHSASGKRILTGTFAAFSRALAALVTHLVCLGLQHAADRQPERVCLCEDDSEGHQVVDVGTKFHVLERVLT